MGSNTEQVTAAPIDLELEVRSVHGSGGLVLEYTFRSPSGAFELRPPTLRSEPLKEPDRFRGALFQQIEKLHNGIGPDGEALLGNEIYKEVTSIGNLLFERLFPSELRQVWFELSADVESVLLISDEPWIPWELVKPASSRDEHDFLCLQFRFSRWLPSTAPPPQTIVVNKMAALEAARVQDYRPLLCAPKESEIIEKLGVVTGTESKRLRDARLAEVEALIQKGGYQLLHFAAHGKYNDDKPDESCIILHDRLFYSRHLIGKFAKNIQNDQPLVFFNVCDAGRQGFSLTGLAGWSERWVRGCHAGAFLGPQWSVGDDQAFNFIGHFYEKLKEGRCLGEATRNARLRLRADNDLNWLTYGLYGHPNARIAFAGQNPVAGNTFIAARRKPRIITLSGLADLHAEDIDRSRLHIIDGSFQSALHILSKVLSDEPRNPRAHLYFAIALMRGKNPGSLPWETVRRIEKSLEIAADYDQRVRPDALHALAIVRHEYYHAHHRQSASLSFSDLLPLIKDLHESADQELLSTIRCSTLVRAKLRLRNRLT